ncbi:MAG TPA: molybdopterin-binding protein [Kofleriaceae bacterium]|nr:molybdopterin-binding protein [Kofleriaceae bacterium]
MATAGIVIIGDEILSGKFAEENAAFLIHELRALGVDLRRIDTIPDDLDDIASTVAAASARFDWVFTSGGVGPTHDDVTMAGVARAFGTTVARHPELEAKVRGYYGAALADANLRLADTPVGAVLLYGQDNVWPVVTMRNVHILPGVPALFQRKFVDIRDRFRGQPVTVARLYVDADEGDIAAAMHNVVATFPTVRLGSYPRFSERDFRVIITFEGPDADTVSAAWQALDNTLGTVVVKRQTPALAGAATPP